MRIREKQKWIVKCGLIVLGLLLLGMLLKGIFDVAYYSVVEEQRAVLKRVGEHVDEKLEKSQIFFQMAVNGQDFLEMSDKKRNYKSQEIMSYGFSSVRIFDERMQLIYKAENAQAGIEMLIKPDDYREMLAGRFVVRGKVNEADLSDSVIIMMLGILGDDMEYRGTIATYMNGQEFVKLLNKEQSSVPGSYFFLTDEAKFFIFSDERYIADYPQCISDAVWCGKMQLHGPTDFLWRFLAEGTKSVYLELPIVNAPWHLILVMPSGKLFSSVAVKMLNQSLFLLIILVLLGVVSWSIIQRRDLRKAKENIKIEKMKMVMQMSASMAHEIKNPLTSLKGFLQYLYYKQKKEHPEQEKFFLIMFDEIDRIEMLANQFCMMAKPEENIKKESFDVGAVLEEIYLLMEAQAKKRNIMLSFVSFPEPVMIWGNRQQLKQIFINLINNAFDAVAAAERADGNVSIYCSLVADKCRLEVRDNGIGIKPEDIKKLCKAFYTTKEQGNGLGLMITNELIRQHKGEMQIESRYGEGTSFIVLLPIYAPES